MESQSEDGQRETCKWVNKIYGQPIKHLEYVCVVTKVDLTDSSARKEEASSCAC
jgi:hypothetical protein